MDDTAYQKFFAEPTNTFHRRYEALRTIFVEGRSQKDVAEEFGFTYGAVRQLVFDFRQVCNHEDNPIEAFFSTWPKQTSRHRRQGPRRPKHRSTGSRSAETDSLQ